MGLLLLGVLLTLLFQFAAELTRPGITSRIHQTIGDSLKRTPPPNGGRIQTIEIPETTPEINPTIPTAAHPAPKVEDVKPPVPVAKEKPARVKKIAKGGVK